MTTKVPRQSVHQIIWAGFAVLWLLVAAIAVLAYSSLSFSRRSSSRLATESVVHAAIGGNMMRALAGAQYHIAVFSLAGQQEAYAEGVKRLEEFQRWLTRARRETERQTDRSKFAEAVQPLESALPEYRAKIETLHALRADIARSRESANARFEQLTKVLSKFAAGSDSDALLDLVLMQQVATIRVETLQAFVDRDPKRAREALAQLLGFKRQTSDNSEIAQSFDALTTDLGTAVGLFGQFEATYARWAADGADMTSRVVAMQVGAMNEVRDVSFDTSDRMTEATLAVMVGLAIALLLGLAIAAFVARRVRHALADIAGQMAATAEELATDANCLAQASSTLSQEASAQAAALQQTRSSVAEITEMTRNNEGIAQKAAAATRTAADTAHAGVEEMRAMRVAVEQIDRSATEIAAIVKTIDEIAFQTNLLALNAAVEAARAGESGAGFAVVAGEVRSLAQKSAEAARMTADKVALSSEKTKLGVAHASRAVAAFDAVAVQARELANHAAEISRVSQHQRAGLEQIESSTRELDRVTQSNVAKAEETAEAAASLHEHVGNVVNTMQTLRGGQVHSPRSRHRTASFDPRGIRHGKKSHRVEVLQS
jgi:methyl-accepting chemotaxis protein